MLSVRVKEGHWLELTHRKSGEVLRVRVYRRSNNSAQLDLAFDDTPRNFAIRRLPEGNPPGASTP